MSTLPQSRKELLEFIENHVGAWETQAPNIGLTVSMVQQLKAMATVSRADLFAVDEARLKSKSATLDFNTGISAMRTFAQGLVERIRIQAGVDGPTVYAKAEIDPPAPPTPLGPPVPPEMVTADPNADGTVTIRWKGSLAGRTFFGVWRRVGDSGAFTSLVSVAAKEWTDTSVPSPVTTGGAQLQYIVRGQRNTEVSGPSNTATVSYGTGAGGSFVATGSGEGAAVVKMAA